MAGVDGVPSQATYGPVWQECESCVAGGGVYWYVQLQWHCTVYASLHVLYVLYFIFLNLIYTSPAAGHRAAVHAPGLSRFIYPARGGWLAAAPWARFPRVPVHARVAVTVLAIG